MAWPDNPTTSAPQPTAARMLRSRIAGVAGLLLMSAGVTAIVAGISVQHHAPHPSTAAAGRIGRLTGLSAARSDPVSLSIPAIGVNAPLLRLGLNRNGTMQVPALPAKAADAAWYKYSVTPGQVGAAVIEGHVDSYAGPAVFFQLGALRPGDLIRVHLADGVTTTFQVTAVRQYLKTQFPANAIYAVNGYAALRVITCGGTFDYVTGHYLSSTVVFASLVSVG
jgi:LPXTG-site transpeptidase (sortase) family protein